MSENCDDLKESRGAVREVPRVQGQPAGKEEDSETNGESWPLLVPKSALVVSGLRYNRLRVMVDHLLCRDGKTEESLLERRLVRTLTARRNYQTALGSLPESVQKRTPPLVEDGEIDGALVAYSNDWILQEAQHHHAASAAKATVHVGASSSSSALCCWHREPQRAGISSTRTVCTRQLQRQLRCQGSSFAFFSPSACPSLNWYLHFFFAALLCILVSTKRPWKSVAVTSGHGEAKVHI